jgi:hypothetical protein
LIIVGDVVGNQQIDQDPGHRDANDYAEERYQDAYNQDHHSSVSSTGHVRFTGGGSGTLRNFIIKINPKSRLFKTQLQVCPIPVQ